MTNFAKPLLRVLLPLGAACLAAACTPEPSSEKAAIAVPSQAKPQPVETAPASPDRQEADAEFAAFVRDFRAEALADGIAPETYDRAMAGVARDPRVEQANLHQPEFVKPVWDYLDGAVSDQRIARAQQMLAANRDVLDRIEQRFGVPRQYLVAIWGIESDFGQSMGHLDMFSSLATLAYAGPRADYGRRELLAAFRMMEQQHLDPRQMTSSWAGAFGQTQFVPTSFLDHAVDGDGDGTIDLWHSSADALASTASLLANAGWKDGERWGNEVTLPAGFDYTQADDTSENSLAEWSRQGVRKMSGAALPASDREAAIYLPAGARGPAFVLFDNFRTVLKYNNADSYALAVCELADRMMGGAPIQASWPRDEVPLTRDERVAFQTDLLALGYDPGTIDGVLGHKARASLRAYQKARGLPADGFATQALLLRMQHEIAAKGA